MAGRACALPYNQLNTNIMAKEVSRLARLEYLKASVFDCITEGINVGDILARVDEEIKKERESVKWSGVYQIVNGCSQECIVEGTEADCVEYTRTNAKYLGECIISPLY